MQSTVTFSQAKKLLNRGDTWLRNKVKSGELKTLPGFKRPTFSGYDIEVILRDGFPEAAPDSNLHKKAIRFKRVSKVRAWERKGNQCKA